MPNSQLSTWHAPERCTAALRHHLPPIGHTMPQPAPSAPGLSQGRMPFFCKSYSKGGGLRPALCYALVGLRPRYVSLQMSDTPYIYSMRTRDSTTNAFPYSRHTFQLMVAIYIHLSWHRLMPRMVPIPSTASTHHHIRPYFKPRRQFDCQFLGHSKRKD